MKVPQGVEASEASEYRSIPRTPFGDRIRETVAPSSGGQTSASQSPSRPCIPSLYEGWLPVATWPKPLNERAEPVETLRFGTFEVDLKARELRKNGVSLKLQEQPFQILEILVTRAGQVVARQDIQEKLWPGSFVSFDRCINTGVSTLRQALGDSVQHPLYIETRSRRGYRFIAPVEPGKPIKALPAQREEGIDSIAVLPFHNAGASAELEYLSDSITESIIHLLSQCPGMRVMARSAVFRYKGRDLDPQDAGRELRVGAVLTGRIVQHDGNLAIDAELVDVDSGWRLWGERCIPEASGVLAVQEEISKKISERLRLRLTGI